MRKALFCLSLLLGKVVCDAQTFRVSIASPLHNAAFDGRLLLLLSKKPAPEPRFQVSDAAGTQLVFGMDVNEWQPGSSQLVDTHAFGYPIERLNEVPAGDYYVQVLLHKYETFHLKNGHTVK